MRRAGRLCAATVLAVALVLGGAAQGAESLKPGKRAVKPLEKDKYAELRDKLGACLVKRSEPMVSKLLAHSDSLTTDWAAMGVDPKMAMFQFRMDLCKNYGDPQVTGPLFVKPGALRTLLMEEAYLAKFPQAPQPKLDEKGEPALAPPRAFVTKGETLPQAVAYAQLADCTAANGTELADKVLRTGAGMPEERAAAVALAPVIGNCVTAGIDVALTPESIRMLAAEGLWHRYAAAPSTQASAQ